MKIAVCYKSVLGTTKKYAEWLGEELPVDIYTFNNVGKDTLRDYDVVFVASGTYAGRMPLVGFLQKHWDILKEKVVISMGIGMATEDDPQSIASYEKIPLSIRQRIQFFRLPGKFFKVKSPMGEPSKKKLHPILTKLERTYNLKSFLYN